ncbi:ATP-binding protein [Streptomyces sp. x-80]|uniref:ATP-binding protein n=1 Tax=Streptomyces sp. x-80 TaxID=2789282 RepID=UPI00397F4BF7
MTPPPQPPAPSAPAAPSAPLRPLTVELLAFPKEVPALRHAVREYLGGPCADVQLCVSEILSNVIRHLGEGTPVTVTVRVSGSGDGRTWVEVTDPDPRALPVLRQAAGDDESGRGIALLDALALCWGVRQGVAGKTVWCVLAGG